MSSPTTATTNTAALDQQLNDMILGGKALEAFDKFYADDVVMQENSEEPRAGKALNRKFEEEFFSSLASWNDGRIEASAVNGDVSFSQWYMDVTFKNGFQYKAAQVAVRRWKDGKVVHERFFYNKG
jgi:ketosteroid isomerase-like protein